MKLAILTLSGIKMGFILIMGNIALSSQEIIDATASPDGYLLWNAALCKPAFLSSRKSNGIAANAVTGKRHGGYGSSLCTHSHFGDDEWWLVDLLEEYLVHKIVITNRIEYASRFNSTNIDLFLADPRIDGSFPTNTNFNRCAEVTTIWSGTKAFDCIEPTYARFVKLWRYETGIMNFCELETMVSHQRESPDQKTASESKPFDIKKNIVPQNAILVLNATTNTALRCVYMCDERRYCDGCLWIDDVSECHILKIEPDELELQVTKEGTDFYMKSPKECLRNGVWKWQYD